MKNIISFICGVLIWIIVCWVTTYYLILFIEKNNNFQPEWCNCSSPDYAQIKMQDIIIEGESTDFEITIMKDKWWMSSYTGSILIIITDEDWETLKDSEYFITQHWLYTFTWSDLWTKRFEKWLTINKKGKYYIEIFDLNANKIWSFPITVINNDNTKVQGSASINVSQPSAQYINAKKVTINGVNYEVVRNDGDCLDISVIEEKTEDSNI